MQHLADFQAVRAGIAAVAAVLVVETEAGIVVAVAASPVGSAGIAVAGILAAAVLLVVVVGIDAASVCRLANSAAVVPVDAAAARDTHHWETALAGIAVVAVLPLGTMPCPLDCSRVPGPPRLAPNSAIAGPASARHP